MKILVTGATGFLGGHTCALLLKSGYDVTGVGRNLEKGRELLKSGVKFHALDLSNAEGLDKIIKEHEIVIHCAAKSDILGHYEEFYNANVVCTQNIINSCLKHNIKRLVYISSPSIYFNFKDELNIKENKPIPIKSANHYIATKKLAENIIDQASTRGLNVITLRPRGLFGPGDPSIMPRIIELATTKKFPFINGGNCLIDLTYVGNVAEAIRCAVVADKKAFGKKYNITNGQPQILKPFLIEMFEKLQLELKTINIPRWFLLGLAAIIEKTSSKPVLTRYMVGVLSYDQTLDITAAIEDLNYKPTFLIHEGVDKYVSWWRENNGC